MKKLYPALLGLSVVASANAVGCNSAEKQQESFDLTQVGYQQEADIERLERKIEATKEESIKDAVAKKCEAVWKQCMNSAFKFDYKSYSAIDPCDRSTSSWVNGVICDPVVRPFRSDLFSKEQRGLNDCNSKQIQCLMDELKK